MSQVAYKHVVLCDNLRMKTSS